MKDKKSRYLLIVIAVICVIGAVSGIRHHWGENVIRGRHHMIKVIEEPENLIREWTEEEITAAESTLRKRYGDGLERVSVSTEYLKGAVGDKITVVTFRASGIRTAESSFCFQVKGTPELFDNFSFQLMKSDALRFWNGKKRNFGLYSPNDGGVYGREDERWNTESYPGETDQLYVYCYGESDIEACAADIADWLIYAAKDERYFLGNEMAEEKETDPLRNIWIYTPKSYYLTNFGEAVEKIKEDSWEEVQRAAARAIAALDSKYHIWEMEIPAEVTDSEGSFSQEEQKEKVRQWYRDDFERECEIEDGRILYRIVVMDAAAGSRWYGLVKSVDRGLSWQVVSDSPFGGDMGMGIEFTFLNEEFGFATLSHNGGDEADLYVTENGGKSYQRSVIQGLDVTLEDGYLYNPYDFPQMPYEENGKLYVLCGQGADGDYDGGDAAGMALFESTDGGHTFSYKEIRKGEKE